jgi:hypothetical protein
MEFTCDLFVLHNTIGVTEIHVKDVLQMVAKHAGKPVYHVIHVHHSGLTYCYAVLWD